MTKNERRRTIITVFMIQFVREGHFGEQNKNKILTTLLQLKNHYGEFSKVKSNAEYALISKAVADIETELVNSEINTTPAMMMIYLTGIAGEYANVSSGLRKLLWQKLYDDITSTEEYQEIINKVPGKSEIEQADTAAFIESVFENSIGYMEYMIEQHGLSEIGRMMQAAARKTEAQEVVEA